MKLKNWPKKCAVIQNSKLKIHNADADFVTLTLTTLTG